MHYKRLECQSLPFVSNAHEIVGDRVYITFGDTISEFSDWKIESNFQGFQGREYLIWRGSNNFNIGELEPASIFEVAIYVQPGQEGTYDLNISNAHDNPDPTEENDVWVNVESNNRGFEKVFSNGAGSVPGPTFESRFDRGEGNQPAAYANLNVGYNIIQFAGRSNGFRMDGLVLRKRNGSAGNPSLDMPVTPELFLPFQPE